MAKSGDGFFSQILKSAIITFVFEIICVFIFSIIVKYAYLGNTTIKTINQFIKVISICVGCFCGIKGKYGLVKGMFSGLLGAIFIYSFFLIIGSEFALTFSIWLDLFFCMICGIIFGISAVNVKSRE